jgi:hypothetical protein
MFLINIMENGNLLMKVSWNLIFLLFVQTYIYCWLVNLKHKYIVTYKPSARQRFGKHISAGTNARRLLLGNGSVNTPKTIWGNRRQCFRWDPPRGYITTSSKGAVSCRELSRVLEMAVEGD